MIKHALVCSLLVCATSAVFAETTTTPLSNDAFNNTGLSLKVGTAGLGFDLTYSFDPRFKVRAGYSFADYSHTVNSDDMKQKGKLDLSNANLLADYYPWAGGFRMTGGLNAIDLKFKGHAEKTAGGVIEIDGMPYSSAEVGTVDLDVQWNGAKPYLGIGYDGFNSSQNGGFYFTTDFGVIVSGAPKVNLTSTCLGVQGSPLCDAVDQDTKDQKEDIKKDLDSIKVLPVIQVGLGYRF